MKAAALGTSLPRVLECHGYAFVRDVGSRSQARAIAEQLGAIRLHRDSDRDGATSIAPTSSTGGPAWRAFSRDRLEPHTDGTAVVRPADLVVNYIEHQSQQGGHVLLADGAEILRALLPHDDWILAALSGGDYVFGAGGLQASVVSRREGQQRWSLRYRNDGELRPQTPRAARALESFGEVVRASTWELPSQSGDLYVSDNKRCLHGRTAFVGSRSVVRFLVDAPRLDLGVALD